VRKFKLLSPALKKLIYFALVAAKGDELIGKYGCGCALCNGMGPEEYAANKKILGPLALRLIGLCICDPDATMAERVMNVFAWAASICYVSGLVSGKEVADRVEATGWLMEASRHEYITLYPFDFEGAEIERWARPSVLRLFRKAWKESYAFEKQIALTARKSRIRFAGRSSDWEMYENALKGSDAKEKCRLSIKVERDPPTQDLSSSLFRISLANGLLNH
jgi:hypothetical protein